MPDTQSYEFEFTVQGLPESTFIVHSFRGQEGLSELYRFDVLLVSEDKELDYTSIVQANCQLVLKGRKQKLVFNGVISSFTQKQSAKVYTVYQVVVMPEVFNLSLTQHNQIFLDKSLPEIIESVLKENEITKYNLRLKEFYPTMEYVCQFNESHFHFLSRLMESRGVYYFFEQGENGDTFVVTDTLISHVAFSDTPLQYLPPSGLDEAAREDAVKALVMEHNSVPQNVLLKDYSYMHPSMDLKAQAPVSNNGVGTHYTYGDNFQDPEDAKRLAKVRADQFLCTETLVHGESCCPAMLTGYTFALNNHYSDKMNAEYLVTKVKHAARNRTAFTTGTNLHNDDEEHELSYSNSFTAIPSDRQFRPPSKTEKSRFFGMLSATVDAGGQGEYAQLDDMGRYKIKLPFDLAGEPGGKASSWIRLAQPYAGQNYGMHFPLLKGTEVLLSFVEGDIDRPIITSAMHNAENNNHVTDKNNPVNSIRSAGGSEMAMGDNKGKRFIGMGLPNSKSGMVFCESNDDNEDPTSIQFDHDHVEGHLAAKTEITVGSLTECVAGVRNGISAGGRGELFAGMAWEAFLGQSLGYSYGTKVDFGDERASMHDVWDALAGEEISLKAGMSQPVDMLRNKLKMYFHGVIANTLTAGMSTFTAVNGFSDPKANLTDNFKSWRSIVGDCATTLNTGFGAALSVAIHTLIKQVQQLQQDEKNYTTMLELSKKHGAMLEVESKISSTAQLVMTVGNQGKQADCSAINISSKGEKITLTNRKDATFTMNKGKSIQVQQGKDSVAKVDTQGFSAWKGKHSVVSVTSDKISVNHGQNGMLASNQGLKMTAANGVSDIQLQSSGITMKSPQLTAKGGSLVKINSNGLIMLG